jgi:hypothetical protein
LYNQLKLLCPGHNHDCVNVIYTVIYIGR